jgi:AraC family transcriptional regulator of adaptative response/methylated-DNA-[protein]-cysteine methyltransferase
MQATTMDIEEATARAAFEARDRKMDGRFVVGVKTTGIYCRPSCPARRPRPDNIEILPTTTAARAAGYRPCLRCLPDGVAPDRVAVERVLGILKQSEEAPSLTELAEMVGYTPHHFRRIFIREVGLSPSAYVRALRITRLGESLGQHERITDAIYDAGYEAPSRAYADASARMGMTPSAWRRGGEGVTIRYAVLPTSLGDVLVAATDKGLCRISFQEGEDDLRARFPHATITLGDGAFNALMEEVVSLIDDPSRAVDLPMDVAGTAFQEAIWAALRAIPAGETRTYKQLAESIGKPGAVRAAGSACGDNALAVLIPCHRVLRSDGALGGYAWGLDRKAALLKREAGAKGGEDRREKAG